MPIVENSICNMQYHLGVNTGDSVQIVREDMLCAGNSKKDSCQVGPRVLPQPPPSLPREPH